MGGASANSLPEEQPIDPPPPTPPHHAQERVEGGEITVHAFAFSRRDPPEVCQKIPCPHQKEGAGKAGCALHPRSRVQIVQKNAHTSIQVQRRQSDFPCAVVLRLYRALPGDQALGCHRRLRSLAQT